MTADPALARKIVLLAVFGLLAINTYRGRLSTADVTVARRLWATGVLAIMLGVAADVAPTIAGPFALLILAGSLSNGGDKAIQNMLDRLSGAPPARSTTTTVRTGLPAHVTNTNAPYHPGANA